jgi:hypothetical protein
MKNITICLIMMTIGLCSSTYTNVSRHTIGDIYGATLGNDYTRRFNSYNPILCIPLGYKPCAYSVTPQGAAIVNSNTYSLEELEDFANADPALVTRWEIGIYLGL